YSVLRGVFHVSEAGALHSGGGSHNSGRNDGLCPVDGYLWGGAGNFECCDGISCAGRGRRAAREHRNDERVSAEYHFGSDIYSSVGIQYGGGRGRTGDLLVQLRGVSLLFCFIIL